MTLTAGVARTVITPFWGVELTGWGYYIQRTWQRVHDDLNATALVLDDGQRQVAIVALDLMVIDTKFTQLARSAISQATGIPDSAILLSCSHSHNAPSAGGLLGAGQTDPLYEQWAARQAATAAILAWQNKVPVKIGATHDHLKGITFNRTREGGDVDTTLTVLRVDTIDDKPLAVVVGFQAHPTVHTALQPYDVTRDTPGEVCDLLENALRGVTAMYLQGACGDVNFLRHYVMQERCGEPAKGVGDMALMCRAQIQTSGDAQLGSASVTAQIPTRRWTQEEIDHDRDEALRRLETNDVSGWRETIGRVMTNRPDDMVARHGGDELKAVRTMARFNVEWTEVMLRDWQERPEVLETEVQALRVGDLIIAANSSEFFTSLALDVRKRSEAEQLMISGYSNGRIGYMPDAHDVERKTYAAYQSPKYCNQFPFTAESGPAMCDAMLQAVQECRA